MFAYAMAVGLRQGWLDPGSYGPAVDRAWAALVARLDPAGNLPDVSVGTGQSDNPAYYLDRPRVSGDFHGQAPLLWLVRERIRRSQVTPVRWPTPPPAASPLSATAPSL
jgi:unsaturated rhamnogalacturonyl hydrolase